MSLSQVPAPGIAQAVVFGRLVLAAILGAAIGFERERTGKEAGLRTNILICVGAAMFTVLATRLATPGEATRITANIVTGIGFLGAGTIIRERGRVHGLTTAATIWVVAAVGMAAGGGLYLEAVGAAILVLLINIPLRIWEMRHDHESAATNGRASGPP